MLQQRVPVGLRAFVAMFCARGPVSRGHHPFLIAAAARRFHGIQNLLRFVGVLIPRGFGGNGRFCMGPRLCDRVGQTSSKAHLTIT